MENVFPADSLSLRSISHGPVRSYITRPTGSFNRQRGLHGNAEIGRSAGLIVTRDQLKSRCVATFPIASLLVQRLQACIMPRPESLHTGISRVNLLKQFLQRVQSQI